MRAYQQYLCRLLESPGIYEFSENSISGAEVAALGESLDPLEAQLELAEQEALIATAQ